VPLEQRQDIDRWILSDLQLVIRSAHEHFVKYDLPPVCQAIRKFLDDLSTWYIRRNRRRFWRGASEGDTDKLAAYQTLYEVLVTVCKIAAPIIPFVTEHIYQHLVARRVEGAPGTIHLCDYPQPDEDWIDDELSSRMASLLRVVSLGRSARTASKLKVRQPLAEVVIASADETDRAAAEQFHAHLTEELNVKKVTVRESVAEMCTTTVEINKKVAAPKYGKQLGDIIKALAGADVAEVAARVADRLPVTLRVGTHPQPLEPDDIKVNKDYGQDWAAAEDAKCVVLMDKRLTEELKQEGLARDVVRFVQVARKEAGLELEDRITLSLQTDSDKLKAAIESCKDYIAAETLATEITNRALEAAAGTTEAKIAGQTLRIDLQQA
jgi:isoleucyl-tRNA synthetase